MTYIGPDGAGRYVKMGPQFQPSMVTCNWSQKAMIDATLQAFQRYIEIFTEREQGELTIEI